LGLGPKKTSTLRKRNSQILVGRGKSSYKVARKEKPRHTSAGWELCKGHKEEDRGWGAGIQRRENRREREMKEPGKAVGF